MPTLPGKKKLFSQIEGNAHIKKYNEGSKWNAADTKSETGVIQLLSFIQVLRFSSSNNCRKINVKWSSIPKYMFIYLFLL